MPQFLLTGLIATNPTQLCATASPKFARSMIIIAQKSLDGSSGGKANAGNVYLGHSATDAQQPLVFGPGDERVFNAPAGMSFDLSRWYLKVANDNDGVVVIYE